MTTDIQRVGRAIKALASEHGTPNRFACFEVADYAGLSNLRVGNLVARRIGEIERETGFDLYREPDQDGYTYIGVQEHATNPV